MALLALACGLREELAELEGVLGMWVTLTETIWHRWVRAPAELDEFNALWTKPRSPPEPLVRSRAGSACRARLFAWHWVGAGPRAGSSLSATVLASPRHGAFAIVTRPWGTITATLSRSLPVGTAVCRRR